MKTFIGERSLRKILTLFKTELGKKEDLMSEFTDEQIQEMWDNPNVEEIPNT